MPWSLAMISTRSFCQMPTHEYVVPRSMPMAGPSTLLSCGQGEKAREGGARSWMLYARGSAVGWGAGACGEI